LWFLFFVVCYEKTYQDKMPHIEPCSLDSGDEELRAIGSGTSISHGENARTSMLQLEVLILKLVTVDGLATSSVTIGEVSTL
jgi:hypothetical protein